MVKFPVMTNLKNHTDNLSHGVLKPCQLTFNRKFEWLSESRSNADGSLSISFLSEYAAAVQIDYAHALSRTIRADKHALDPKTDYQVLRQKLTRDAMIAMMKERSRLQNMCCTDDDWNAALNEFVPFTCVNFFSHRSPQTFDTENAFNVHRKTCAGPVAGPSGRGRGRGKQSKSHPKH